MKVLVAGWFSFELMGASAGDIFAREVVCGWLTDAGVAFDIAVAPPFTGGVNWRTVDTRTYDALVFVCGPIGNGPPLVELLDRFAERRLVALDVSLLQPRAEWNPFDVLIERDSDVVSRPDLSLLSTERHVPLAGVLLIDVQPEYGARDRHVQANEAIRRLIAARPVAAIAVDTRLDANTTGLRTPAEIDSVVGRMDLVLTTRLHGLVLAIKNGVPPVAVDPVAGGGKITRQAAAIGWPLVFDADTVTDTQLVRAFDYCLTESARAQAESCRQGALRSLEHVHQEVLSALAGLSSGRED